MYIPILDTSDGTLLTDKQIKFLRPELRIEISGPLMHHSKPQLFLRGKPAPERFLVLRDFDNVQCPKCGKSCHVYFPFDEDTMETTCLECQHFFEVELVEYITG